MADYKELVSVLRSEADGFLMADAPDVLMADSLNDAADAIEKLVSTADKFKWISVEERLPEEETDVIVARTYLGVNNCYRCKPKVYVEIARRSCIGEKWVAFSDEYKANRKRHTDPYAWMPLPEPPKEEEHDE